MIALVAVLCTLWATSAAHVLVAVDDGGTITYYTVPVAVPEAQPGPQFGVQPRPPFGVQPRRGFGARPPPINPDAEEVPPVNTGPGGGGAGRPGFVPVLPRARPGGVPGMVPGGYPTVVYHQQPPTRFIIYTHHPAVSGVPHFTGIHLQTVSPPLPRGHKPRRPKPKEEEDKPKKPTGPKEMPERVDDKKGVTPPPPPGLPDREELDPSEGKLLKTTSDDDNIMERIEEDKDGDKEETTTPVDHDEVDKEVEHGFSLSDKGDDGDKEDEEDKSN